MKTSPVQCIGMIKAGSIAAISTAVWRARRKALEELGRYRKPGGAGRECADERIAEPITLAFGRISIRQK